MKNGYSVFLLCTSTKINKQTNKINKKIVCIDSYNNINNNDMN